MNDSDVVKNLTCVARDLVKNVYGYLDLGNI